MPEENNPNTITDPSANKSGQPSNGCLLRGIFYLVCFGGMIGLLLPTIHSGPNHNSMACSNNLSKIALALMKYEYYYQCFPPAYTVDHQGKPMHSWRALILPFFDNSGGKLAYDFSQPWNSPANIVFAEESPLFDYYHCPSDIDDGREFRNTSYVFLVGHNAFGSGESPRKYDDITDGMSCSIMVAEMSQSGIFWTEPRDLKTTEMSYKINDSHQIGIRSKHGGLVQVSFCDGHLEMLCEDMPEKTLKAMITINGGENMDELRK